MKPFLISIEADHVYSFQNSFDETFARGGKTAVALDDLVDITVGIVRIIAQW